MAQPPAAFLKWTWLFIMALAWVAEHCGSQRIPGSGVKVTDPLGKWSQTEKVRVGGFMQQWQEAKMLQNTPGGMSLNRPRLTTNQLDWLDSLANETKPTNGPRGRRRKRQAQIITGPRLIRGDNINFDHVRTTNARFPSTTTPSPTVNRRSTTTTSAPTFNRWRSSRKEIRQMTRRELYRFSRAVYMMKQSFPDSRDSSSEYDIFMQLHQFAVSPGAHGGAAFLPWHREYLFRFERAMRRHVPDASIPYWDTTLDQELPVPQDSILWTSTFLGNSDGVVSSGPFANFLSTPECDLQGDRLTRRMGSCPNPRTFLYSDEDIDYIMRRTTYKDISPNIDSKFEEDHGASHVCVGGHMGSVSCSPLDPVFFMLHSFIDCVWQEFRQTRQLTNVETDYPTWDDGDIGGDEHAQYANMEPFRSYYNIHGLSSHYNRLYYECTPRPGFCRQNQDCGSNYLWCNTRRGRCMSMIRNGGDCTGFPDDACYGSTTRCTGNICTRTRVDWSWWFRN